MGKLHSLNSTIVERLARIDPHLNKSYIVNTSTVARHRLDIVNSVAFQIEKNPNKARKSVKRLVHEINFGSTLSDLIKQAEDELEKINHKIQ